MPAQVPTSDEFAELLERVAKLEDAPAPVPTVYDDTALRKTVTDLGATAATADGALDKRLTALEQIALVREYPKS